MNSVIQTVITDSMILQITTLVKLNDNFPDQIYVLSFLNIGEMTAFSSLVVICLRYMNSNDRGLPMAVAVLLKMG